MVAIASKSAGGNAAQNARAEAPRFERVSWFKEPHLRTLYIMSIFLLIASATTGYDGMLANTCQQMDDFKEYFDDVFTWDAEEETWVGDENLLGIMINMFNIGSIVSFFMTPYVADRFGRKPTIMVGCVIMIIGACISAFTNGYGSEYIQPLTLAARGRQTLLQNEGTGGEIDCDYSVVGGSILARVRKLTRTNVFANASHRDLPPATPRPPYCRLQLPMAPGRPA